MPFDFLSVLVVGGGSVCLPTPPSWFSQERILKAARENDIVTYKGIPIRLSADFLKETLQTSRGYKEVF